MRTLIAATSLAMALTPALAQKTDRLPDDDGPRVVRTIPITPTFEQRWFGPAAGGPLDQQPAPAERSISPPEAIRQPAEAQNAPAVDLRGIHGLPRRSGLPCAGQPAAPRPDPVAGAGPKGEDTGAGHPPRAGALRAARHAHRVAGQQLAVPQMSEDTETMQRWEALAQKANEVFAGQPMEDVGGALALLTAMLVVGIMQDEEFADQDPKAVAAMIVAKHAKLVMSLIPSFLEAVEERGGWDEMHKKGRH